jgi:hypothetical protein
VGDIYVGDVAMTTRETVIMLILVVVIVVIFFIAAGWAEHSLVTIR